MDLERWVIWVSFVFCLALTAGGILLLFRFKKLSKLNGYKYLQYSIVLVYTFGFYSLWSQIFINHIPEFIQFSGIDYIKRTVFLMGTPFLFFGMIMQVAWAYHCQEKSKLVTMVTVLLPILLILGIVLSYFLTTSAIDSSNLVEVYSLVALTLSSTTLVVFLVGKTLVLPAKRKSAIVLFLLLSGVIFLGNFQPFESNIYYAPVFVFLFFLTNTLVEALFMYSAQVDESKDIELFEDFVHKFQITRREDEIVREIYNGKSNQEIADQLFVTLQTVKDHTSRIYQKTDVRSRSQLIALLRDYF